MEAKTIQVKRRKYDAAFKQDVLNMVFNGRAVKEVSQSLGIGENLIYRWKSRAKATSTAVEVALGDQEALYKRIKELEMERDILKKALAIFSRQTWESCMHSLKNSRVAIPYSFSVKYWK